MEFNETLFTESNEFRNQYPDLINLGIDIDEYLISIFNSSFSDKYHQGLLRLVNAFRRNFLLSWFLFESGQWNVWIQAMRTMIESWELVCLYLFDSVLIYDEILNSGWKPILDELIKKYAIQWIRELNDISVRDKAAWILQTKTSLNNLLTHVNPSYNLRFASGFDFSDSSWIVAWYTDGNNEQGISNYIYLIWAFLELVNLISLLWTKTAWKNFLSSEFNNIPDFHLEKYIEKYVPHRIK